jgi:hypothetical protein
MYESDAGGSEGKLTGRENPGKVEQAQTKRSIPHGPGRAHSRADGKAHPRD